MKILALIPAYNAAERIGSVIQGITRYLSDFAVIDDGSDDGTGEVASRNNAIVLSHSHNKGKGAALKTGFAYAVGHFYDAVITLDADGQHNPEYIPSFVKEYAVSGADLIIGSRIHDVADMPWDRRLSNSITSHLLSSLLRTRIEDSQCGFRLYSRKAMGLPKLKSDRFEFETEAIIAAVRCGLNMRFVPVRVDYGPNFPTHMNPLFDTLRWCRMVLKAI
jgi:glycosyltransferase involved in cell wall biosynthesis